MRQLILFPARRHLSLSGFLFSLSFYYYYSWLSFSCCLRLHPPSSLVLCDAVTKYESAATFFFLFFSRFFGQRLGSAGLLELIV